MKKRLTTILLALVLALSLLPAGALADGDSRFVYYGENDPAPGTYYYTWNVNNDILPADSGLTGNDAELARAEIRWAICLLIDRTGLGPEGSTPASGFVAQGILDVDGSQFYQNAGPSEDYTGFFDAGRTYPDRAITTLKNYYDYDESTGKFTNVPTLTLLYNQGEAHLAIAESVRDDLAEVGIDLALEETEWDSLNEKISGGEYELARAGWLADYADPLTFLEIFTSGNADNNPHLGSGAHASATVYTMDLTPYGLDIKVPFGTWAQTYDVLIDQIKTVTDETVRFQLMHVAENQLMSTGCICPLYFYPYEETEPAPEPEPTPEPEPAPAPAITFDDVAPDAWYAKAVDYAVTNGITNGTSDTTFSPEVTCTNAHILTFLWRAAGQPEPGIDNPFDNNSDPEGWYYKPAIWAFEKGMVTGSSFAANDPCTRASAAKFIWQAMGSPADAAPSDFSDIAADADYKTAVDWAVSAGVTDGVGNNQFAPDTICNRGHIVTFLYRAFAQ